MTKEKKEKIIDSIILLVSVGVIIAILNVIIEFAKTIQITKVIS